MDCSPDSPRSVSNAKTVLATLIITDELSPPPELIFTLLGVDINPDGIYKISLLINGTAEEMVPKISSLFPINSVFFLLKYHLLLYQLNSNQHLFQKRLTFRVTTPYLPSSGIYK